MTSYVLKMIAIIAMLIDHIGYVFINPAEDMSMYLLFRGIGRIAFPIFCFLIVEGYQHTKNVYKYFFRLTIFALISEVPFDLAFGRKIMNWDSQNVFFTLALGLMTIHVINWVYPAKFLKKEDKNNPFSIVLYGLIILVMTVIACIAAEKLSCDYGYKGICLIVVLYVCRENRLFQSLIGSGVLVITSIIGVYQKYVYEYSELDTTTIKEFFTNLKNTLYYAGGTYYYSRGDWNITLKQSSILVWMQLFAVGGLVLTLFYNGKKGTSLRYLFYVFYPVHLLLLYLFTFVI